MSSSKRSEPPDQVQVGPHRYTIQFDDTALNIESVREGEDLVGHCDRRALRILVRTGMAHDQEADTLLHETLHALCEVIGFDSELGEMEEETFVRRLTPILLDTLRRNPALVAYLTDVRV